MVAIASLHQSNALLLLKSQRQTSAVEGFLIGPAAFPARSAGVLDGILAAFQGSSDLREQFKEILSAKVGDTGPGRSGMHPDNARHIALVEVILANRGDFPPGEFSIHTELPDGASITTYIPAAGSTRVSHDRSAENSAARSAMLDAQARIVSAMMAAPPHG